MRKLIEYEQGTIVVCDNKDCDFKIDTNNDDPRFDIMYIDKACPKCGENLCTSEDYMTHERLRNIFNFINKWFSWITIFYKKDTKTTNLKVHVHNGVHFEKALDNGEIDLEEEKPTEEIKYTWRNLEDYVKK